MKKCPILVVLLLLAVAGMAWKFILQGSTKVASDGRAAIQLTPAEKDLVLTEMRAFLESVQQITEGVSKKDMKQVVAAARKVGRAAQQEVPGSLMGKLPLGFKKLGFDTHTRFDDLALDAEDLEDPGHALEQLVALERNCVACHGSFRLQAVGG
ncbi:MAG: hypothetical protein DSZ32_02330 [Gammaproteobacteria bacterium]|nr:MAG: hypothetical protein DSZ32_02330 [Gammaproteobacteria bacterium]